MVLLQLLQLVFLNLLVSGQLSVGVDEALVLSTKDLVGIVLHHAFDALFELVVAEGQVSHSLLHGSNLLGLGLQVDTVAMRLFVVVVS